MRWCYGVEVWPNEFGPEKSAMDRKMVNALVLMSSRKKAEREALSLNLNGLCDALALIVRSEGQRFAPHLFSHDITLGFPVYIRFSARKFFSTKNSFQNIDLFLSK